LASQQFRVIPSPSGIARTGFFYASAATFPRDLWDWRQVNPREVNRRSAVYRQILQTLTSEPERFHERNRGITVVAEDLSFDDKRKEVLLTLNDEKLHGIVDGAHTMDAILGNPESAARDGLASVRIH
jgi:hypothetical protein